MQLSTLNQSSNLNLVLNYFKTNLKTIYQDNFVKLILFGSQARGDAKPDSDIDVLVVLKNTSNFEQKRQQVIKLISDLCLEHQILISCVYVNEYQFSYEKSPLLINIRREGILI